MKRTTLRRVSMRRLSELSLYHYRRKLFLRAHPYCQVWLAEHGVQEETAIRQGGRVECGGVMEIIPLSTEIHHKNKRRGGDLLDQDYWMAVSLDAHRGIEGNKAWARALGYSSNF